MSGALANLQASSAPADLVASFTVETCLAQGVVKRVQELSEELEALNIESYRTEDDESASDRPARKMAQGQNPRIDEIRVEMEALQDKMLEHTGHVTFARTQSFGEWRLWADAHPAREEGRDKNNRPIVKAFDIGATGGFCDGTALLDRLGDFVTEWNGEPLAPGQWEWLRENMPLGDQKVGARGVVAFYEVEGAKAPPKSPSGSSETTPKSPGSASPDDSASPANDSSAGSPPSDTSTSTPKGT